MLRSITLILVVVFASILTAFTADTAQAEFLNFETDTSWRAIAPVGDNEHTGINHVGLTWEASNVGWNSSLVYDDSAWNDAINNGHPVIPNAIWAEGNARTGPTPSYFRKIIDIGGTPDAGTVDFFLDDDIQLYVNGNLVLDDANGTAEMINGVNLMPHLVEGQNLIAGKVHDHQRNEGIYGDFNIAYNLDPVPEPSTFVLLSLGLVGLAFFGRRHYRSRK